MIRHHLWAVCLTAAGLFLATAVEAQLPSQEGITVAGSAVVKGKPTEVEIGAIVAGEAELTNDAMVKYRDARKRALAAVEGLKVADLSIESNGVSINQAIDPNQAQQMMQGRGMSAIKPKVQASESMKVVLKGIDKMTSDKLMDTIMKVIDTGRDAGLQIGPPTPQNYYQYQMAIQNGQGQGMLMFKIADTSGQRDQAYKLAMEDAKARAKHLADLAGVKLGRIVAVHDSPAVRADTAMAWMYTNMGQQPPDPSDLSSQLLADISLKVTLTVQFEIVK